MSRHSVSVDFDEAAIDAIVARLDQSVLPGAVVGIAIDGQPVYRKGFGLANMELPVPLSPRMRMRVGSITKHFTSLAYLLLCEEGRASLDDSIGKYLPDLHPVTHRVTMRQLMGHTSGLRDAHDICYQLSGAGRAVSSADLLSMYESVDDVNAEPGTTWNYNNGGYLILSAVLEKISDQPLEAILKERIFAPMGMRETMLRRFDTDFVPNSATLHMTCAGGGFEKSYLGTAFAGEGGVVSTVDDMLRWLAQMEAPSVGSRQIWERMKTPHTLANGHSTGYGLGLIVGAHGGVATLSHLGSVMGGSAHMLKMPAVGLDLIAMSNRHDVTATQIASDILSCLVKSSSLNGGADVMPATGTFVSRETGLVIQLLSQEGRQVASINGADIELKPDAEGVLRPAPAMEILKQSIALIGDRAAPATIRFTDFGNVYELAAVPPGDAASAGRVVGMYRSTTTGTDITVTDDALGLRLCAKGRFGSAMYRLECLSDGLWRAKPDNGNPWWGGIVSRDAKGAAIAFSSARNRRLHLQRVG